MCNPFQIKTPENLTVDETLTLFVDENTDLPKIKTQGHTFIMGPRGIGKSMLLRYLQPDCQCKDKPFQEVDFLGFYVPLRNAGFTNITEMIRLEKNAAQFFHEHMMTTYFLQKGFSALSNADLYIRSNDFCDELKTYYYNTFLYRLMISNPPQMGLPDGCTVCMIFEKMATIMEEAYLKTIRYVKTLSFAKATIPYEEPLYDYLDFLIPLMSALKKISVFSNKQLCFLIDDAHMLNSQQTQVLNYWVSTRTSGTVGLKISTQYNYKHYYTITGTTIDAPHDYSEIDMSTVYTGSVKNTYLKRVTKIIEKRLLSANIRASAEKFFAEDKLQEQEIRKIAEAYKRRFDQHKGKGNKRGDDALRYARPDYIKSLAGESKSSHSYSYAGFQQLVHLSSGIVRYFLEAAYKMYAEEASQKSTQMIEEISPKVQNEVIRKEADKFLFQDLIKYGQPAPDEYLDEFQLENEVYPKEEIEQLSNLIQGLGGLYRQILLSDRSERKVFSMFISDKPSKDVEKILKLGIELGYFHRSTIGRKDGQSGGRTALYIMNRRLAPIWTLDPTGFAGYLSIKNHLLEEAMREPFALLRRMKSKYSKQSDWIQTSLFDEDFVADDFSVIGGDMHDENDWRGAV